MAQVTRDFLTCPFTVYRDSQEQAPWTFTGLRADAAQRNLPLVVPVEWHTLGRGMGDYTIAGMEDGEHGWRVSIERKSLTDLYGTLLNGRERFQRELTNLDQMDSAHVVVEANWDGVMGYSPNHWDEQGYDERKRAGMRKSVRRSIVAWAIDFPSVHWWLMPGREAAEAIAFRLLWKFWERTEVGRVL